MAGRHTAPSRRARKRRRFPWRSALVVAGACGVAVVLVGGVRTVFLGDSAAADDCRTDVPVSVVVTPEMRAVVEEAVGALDAVEVDGGCASLDVSAQPAAALLHAVEEGSADLPDLWLPDASAWLSQLPRDAVPDDSDLRRFAKTPVVLVGHEGASRPGTWLEALGADGSVMRDPRTSAAAVGTMAALHGESVSEATSGSDLAAWMVSTAQGSGGADTAAEGRLYRRAAKASADAPAFFPSTEQRFLSRLEDDPGAPLTAVLPDTGSVLLDYPLALLGGADVRPAFEALGEQLQSASTAGSLAAAGFRPPSGEPRDDPFGVGEVDELGLVDASGVDRLLRQWVMLTVRTRMLAVIDVSGSMEAAVEDQTRMQLAINAALASLEFMPGDAELGIWAFSIGLGEGNNRDFREIVPVKTLGRGDDGHRAAVAEGVRSLGDLTGGGTGLYDTTLAAFRTATATFDPARSNSVVVLTDGENEDSDGLSLRQLIQRLESEQDPATPVQIVTIGMGPDADTDALQRISTVTDGSSHVAKDPRDIGRIFTEALLERVGWGLR